MSSKTEVNKGGGVAIWIPRDISSKQLNDLNVLNESFFKSLWVEISELLVNKILIKASYCSDKSLETISLTNFHQRIPRRTQSLKCCLLVIIISIILMKVNFLYWMILRVFLD